MNALPFTPSEVLEWYLEPDTAKKADPPSLPFDAPLTDLQKSINLTLHFLMATRLDNGHHRPHLANDPNGKTTLVWRVYVEGEVNKRITDVGTRTQRKELHYGFDLAGNLVLETDTWESRESPLRQTWSWPDPSDLPDELKDTLLNRLMNFRGDFRHMLLSHKSKKVL